MPVPHHMSHDFTLVYHAVNRKQCDSDSAFNVPFTTLLNYIKILSHALKCL